MKLYNNHIKKCVSSYIKKGGVYNMMKYNKLFALLTMRDMKKSDLVSLKVISSPTLAKLSKGESVTTDVLCKICDFLQCQPSDIMEYVPDENKTK